MCKHCQLGSAQYRCEKKNGWHIIHVAESVEFQRDFSWLQEMVEKLCADDHPRVALAFDRKSYLHSKLIAVIVACARKVKAKDGVVGLLAPGPHVVSTLRAMKLLDEVIAIYPSENDLN